MTSNNNHQVSLTFNEAKTIWELLCNENHRIKDKVEASPKPLDYWIEKKEEVEQLLTRFNNHLKVEE